MIEHCIKYTLFIRFQLFLRTYSIRPETELMCLRMVKYRELWVGFAVFLCGCQEKRIRQSKTFI